MIGKPKKIRGSDRAFSGIQSRKTLLLASLIIFHIITNVYVIRIDTNTLSHHEDIFFQYSQEYLEALSTGDFSRLITIDRLWPPLHRLGTLPFYVVLGVSQDSALISQSLWSIVSLLSIYLLTRSLADETAGLLAASIAILTPGFYAMSRTYWQEPSAGAILLLSLVLLDKSNYLANRGYVLAFGALQGIGKLARINYEFFVAGPLVVYWILGLRQSRKKRDGESSHFLSGTVVLAASLVIGVLIMSLWYIPNWGHISNYYVQEHVAENAGQAFDWSTGPFSIVPLTGRFFYRHVGSATTIIFLLALFLLRREKQKLLFLGSAIIIPLLFHAQVTHYLDSRYLPPMIGVICIISGIGLKSVLVSSTRGRIIAASLLGLLVLQFSYLSFFHDQFVSDRSEFGTLSPRENPYETIVVDLESIRASPNGITEVGIVHIDPTCQATPLYPFMREYNRLNSEGISPHNIPSCCYPTSSTCVLDGQEFAMDKVSPALVTKMDALIVSIPVDYVITPPLGPHPLREISTQISDPQLIALAVALGQHSDDFTVISRLAIYDDGDYLLMKRQTSSAAEGNNASASQRSS